MSKKIALLIGNESYSDPLLTELMVPAADVRALEAVLKRSDISGFDQVDILLNPSLSDVMRAIGALFANKKRDDLLLLYFSGHGLVDVSGELYLALKDTQLDLPVGTALSASFIKEAMNKSRSRRQVLILDACHSGAFERGAKGIGTPAVTEATFEVSGYGREILTSSSATQLSWEGDHVMGKTDKSLFTHYLVEGLESGKAAPEGGEQITVEQLYHYAHDQVVHARPGVNPQRWVDRQQGSFVIARNPKPEIKSRPLPEELKDALEDHRHYVREAAVRKELAPWMKSADPSEVLAATQTLTQLSKTERDFEVRKAIDEVLGSKAAIKAGTDATPKKVEAKQPDVHKNREPGKKSTPQAEPTPIKERKPAPRPVTDSTGKERRFSAGIIGLIAAIVVVVLIVGLSQQQKQDVVLSDEPSVWEAEQAVKTQQINEWLERAERAFADNHLTTPVEDNALNAFREVLQLDPDNAKAQQGLKRILEQYLAWAEQAINRRSFDKAEKYLEKAQLVEPGHYRIRQLREQLPAPPTATKQLAGTFIRDSLKSGGEGPEMVVIPAGRFTMGSPESEESHEKDEELQHPVTFARPFAMGKYAVTFAEYDRFVATTGAENPGDEGWGRGSRPVINISWDEAKAYTKWLSKETGKPYRLPSEAEWEYVARAKTKTPFHFGTTINTEQANYNGGYVYGSGSKGEYRGQTVEVGAFPPNAWGLHQVHGNVYEWVEDCWNANYRGASDNGRPWTTGECGGRVLRGGSWFGKPGGLRSANRGGADADTRSGNVGFRLARDIK